MLSKQSVKNDCLLRFAWLPICEKTSTYYQLLLVSISKTDESMKVKKKILNITQVANLPDKIYYVWDIVIK